MPLHEEAYEPPQFPRVRVLTHPKTGDPVVLITHDNEAMSLSIDDCEVILEKLDILFNSLQAEDLDTMER